MNKKVGGYLLLDLIPQDKTTWDTAKTTTGTASCDHATLVDVVRSGTAVIIPHLEIVDGGNVFHLHSIHPTIEDSFLSHQEHTPTLIFNVTCGANHTTFRFEYTNDNVVKMSKLMAAAAASLEPTVMSLPTKKGGK